MSNHERGQERPKRSEDEVSDVLRRALDRMAALSRNPAAAEREVKRSDAYTIVKPLRQE